MKKNQQFTKTGISIIDEEHQIILQKINELSDAIKKGFDKAKIAPLLNFLLQFSTQHFSAEEKLMREKDFPLTASHVEKHKEFLSSIAELEKDYTSDGPSTQLVQAVNTLLYNWLKNHITEFDKPLADFLKNNK